MDFLSPEEEHRWPAPHKQWWLSSGLNLLMNNEELCFPCFLSSSSNSHIKSCLQVGGERNWKREPLMSQKKRRAIESAMSKLALYVYKHGKKSDSCHLSASMVMVEKQQDSDPSCMAGVKRCQQISRPGPLRKCLIRSPAINTSGTEPVWSLTKCKVWKVCLTVIPVYLEQRIWPWHFFKQKPSHVTENLHYIWINIFPNTLVCECICKWSSDLKEWLTKH